MFLVNLKINQKKKRMKNKIAYTLIIAALCVAAWHFPLWAVAVFIVALILTVFGKWME